MAYKKVFEILNDLDNKKLACFDYELRDGSLRCAIGEVVKATRKYGEDGGQGGIYGIRELAQNDSDVREELAELGMSVEEAHELQEANDEDPYESAEARYERVMDFLAMN